MALGLFYFLGHRYCVLVRGSVEGQECAQCRKSVLFHAMSDGTAMLFPGEQTGFPQACQVVGDGGLAQRREFGEFRDAHRSAAFIAQDRQQPEAGWVR